MSGRYALFKEPEQIKSHFKITKMGVLKPRYNIAPSFSIPIIIKDTLEYANWGFTPDWLIERGEKTGPINAHIESLEEKAMFKYAWRKCRCLIPFSGFYEWKDGTRKQPYFFRAPEDIAAFAGIYTSSHLGNSVAIITKDACDLTKDIHGRAPVIVKPEYYSAFLAKGSLKCTDDFFCNIEKYFVYPVTTAVGNITKDLPEYILPLK